MENELLQHIPCSVTTFANSNSGEQQSNNLKKVKIIVMHEGVNSNRTNFSEDSVDSAKESLKNIPILAYIKRDEDGVAEDFDQHNIITKIVPNDDGGNDIQRYYLERPIGVIPETNNYRIEKINGINHVVVDGYVWKNYSNEGYDIITESEGGKGVSMEIEIEEGSRNLKTGIYNIDKYNYLGVTVLGDDVPPAMGNTCKLQVYSLEDREKVCKYALDQLNTEIQKLEKEEKEMEIEQKENNQKQLEDNQQTSQDMNFNLSIENLSNSIRKTLQGRLVDKKYSWSDETYQVQEFYLRTIIPAENIAIVEDNISDYTHYGVSYTLEGDEVVLNFEDKQEYIQTWRKKDSGENNTNLTFSENGRKVENELIKQEFNKVTEKVAELENQVNEKELELVELREFKSSKDKETLEKDVQDIITKFSSCLEEADYKDFKEKALNKEITLDNFKTQMYALKGMKQEQLEKQQAEQYSKDIKDNGIRIPVSSNIEEPKHAFYGSLTQELDRISKSR